MSINFNFYGVKTNDMNIADLIEGQTITRIYTPTTHWGDLSGEFRTEDYTVVKVLKTRLVLERQADGTELRMIVDQKKWSIRSGEVTTDREGNSQGYGRTAIQLATEDEPVIEQMRQHWNSRVQEQKDQREAQAAIAAIKDNLKYADLEHVEAAIQALQVLADNLRAKQA
jgi:hypothetical protein